MSTVVPVVAAVEAIRAELQALQNIHSADRTSVLLLLPLSSARALGASWWRGERGGVQ